jgi:hypothetical protein
VLELEQSLADGGLPDAEIASEIELADGLARQQLPGEDSGADGVPHQFPQRAGPDGLEPVGPKGHIIDTVQETL